MAYAGEGAFDGVGGPSVFPVLGREVVKTSAARAIGGAEGSRTPDLCSAIAALSQLSYSPAARVL